MISINNYSNNQNARAMSDLIEPFIVKRIQKDNHTFFVYRCSEYSNLKNLFTIHKFNLNNFKYYNLFEKYWSAIDIIMIKIKNMPTFSPTKEYFNSLRNLTIKEKNIIEIIPYEVKLSSKNKKSNLSIKTYEFIEELKQIGRTIKIIKVFTKGKISFQIKESEFNKEDYIIKTHYGRKKYTVDLGSKQNKIQTKGLK